MSASNSVHGDTDEVIHNALETLEDQGGATVAAADGSQNQQQQQVPQTAQGQMSGWFDNEDLNGECFVTGEIGEVESEQAHRFVYFAQGMPAAQTPFESTTWTRAQIAQFLLLNAKANALGEGVAVAKRHLLVAYVRFLAARVGLVSPNFATATYNVRYNEARRITAARLAQVNGHATDATVLALGLTGLDRRMLRENFSNYVCCVAYMFRVRGHHYLEEMDIKYKSLWKKCLKEGDSPLLEWKHLAHDAVHAIFPMILDDFWRTCVENGRVAGALVKRFDSAPAGVAAVRAVYSGAQDLQMAVPGIKDRFASHFDDLEKIMEDIKANRWAGSINRRYYGAKAIPFDEQKFGAIASVVYHALEAFAANSPLLKSQALKRVADNAPITGGIVSRSIATAASDPSLVRTMFKITSD